MLQLAYTSLACKPFKQADLLKLLQQSRMFNAQKDVTGILLYKDQSFFQVIEGEDSVVQDLMASISKDYRHNTLTTLYTREISSRNFDLWSMGYVNIDHNHLDLDGYDNNEFKFPLQNLQGNLSELVNIATAKKLVITFSKREPVPELKASVNKRA